MVRKCSESSMCRMHTKCTRVCTVQTHTVQIVVIGNARAHQSSTNS